MIFNISDLTSVVRDIRVGGGALSLRQQSVNITPAFVGVTWIICAAIA